MDKKILKQKVNTSDGGNSLKFQFKFRYFPENVADEVIQDVTLRLLFKQVSVQEEITNHHNSTLRKDQRSLMKVMK